MIKLLLYFITFLGLSLQAEEGFLLHTLDKDEHIKEPSGVCFHSQSKTLFIAGDKGHIAEMTTDGKILRNERIAKADFEGVTHIPKTGNLLVAVEGVEQIWELNYKDFSVLRKIQIDRHFKGKLTLPKGKDGIEAITYNPKTETIFVANQGKKLDSNSPPVICELSIDNDKAKITKVIPMQITDLSGLFYNSKTDILTVISDKNNLLIKLKATGEILTKENLPGKNQEGITFHNSKYYIAQDSGKVIVLTDSF